MKMLFEQFFKKLTGPRGSKMGRFCIAVPADITEVEILQQESRLLRTQSAM